MPAVALRRLLLVNICLAGAALACAYSSQPIQPADPRLATPLPPPATETPVPATATASPEPSATTPPPTGTNPADTVTPGASPTRQLTRVPIDNGAFDVDLSGWTVSDPARAAWQDGYARLDASGETSVALTRTLQAPAASALTLQFRYRSETAAGGTCTLETVFGEARTFLENNQWRRAEVDYTPLAGTEVEVGLTARGGPSCAQFHLDEFYWLVPAGEPLSTATVPATAIAASTDTPVPTLGPVAIPAEAVFTRRFSVKAEGDVPFGIPIDLRDNQTITWASLRNGQGRWLFDLGSPQSVVGLRLVAHRDRDEDTTLLGIDVSLDGLSWAAVYVPGTACGETPACQVLDQATPVELPFGPVEAQHVRLRSGPSAFALAEVELAVLP